MAGAAALKVSVAVPRRLHLVEDARPAARPRCESNLHFIDGGRAATDSCQYKLAARLACVQQARIFAGLALGECTELAACAQERHLGRREMLFREGEPIGDVALMRAGRIKVTQLSAGGMEVILRLKQPGDFIGECALSGKETYCTSAQACDTADVLLWTRTTFARLAERYPLIRRNVVRIFAENLQAIEERFRELATEPVGPRVASMLLRLAAHLGQPSAGAVRLNLSREDIAQMTGTTLFTISRLFSAWETRGIVGARREAVLVYDRRALTQLADSP